jgi:catechol 2,3-dioxygenase-like lactoylglutathione lyase family enzyme
MLHHVDVHVRRLEPVRTLFDALSETIRYRCRVHDDDFVGYEPTAGGRPRVGFLRDEQAGGTMRLAFSVENRQLVDQAGDVLRASGATAIEGPSLHSEYGDYYAVFFEDPDGNKYEILEDSAPGSSARRATITTTSSRFRFGIHATQSRASPASPWNARNIIPKTKTISSIFLRKSSTSRSIKSLGYSLVRLAQTLREIVFACMNSNR